MADDDFYDDDEVMDEAEDIDESEDFEESRPSSSRRSGRSRRSRRSRGAPRKEKAPAGPVNFKLAFILSIFLGPLGIDRFVIGEFKLAIAKLLGTIITGVMIYAYDSIGMQEWHAFAVAIVAGVGLMGSIQLHDLIYFGMHTIGWGNTIVTVYATDFKHAIEVDLDTPDLEEIVCSYEGVRARGPLPPEEAIDGIRKGHRIRLSASVFGFSLFAAIATLVTCAFYVMWPDAKGFSPDEASPFKTAQDILFGGSILLFMVTMWQVHTATKKPTYLEI